MEFIYKKDLFPSNRAQFGLNYHFMYVPWLLDFTGVP